MWNLYGIDSKMEAVVSDGEDGALTKLSNYLGASEAALRLLISIFVGFPVVLFHRYYLYGKTPQLQHIFFFITGLAINYFNYGQDLLHTVVTVLVVYAVINVFHGTSRSPVITLSFTMTYLLTGYYMTGTETYDIKWTMPQCVLTLRLSGLAFDLYDGCQPLESLSSENKKVCLKQVPSFLEVLAYAFFPASFLVGPQFPMKRYQHFVSGDFKASEDEVLPDSLVPALKRTSIGIAYLLVNQIGFMYINDDYLLSAGYQDLSFFKRSAVLGIWGHLALYKYISCWLLVEGVCIASGITYNGKDEKGNTKWDGLSNVDLKVFEGATVFNHYVESFNINTNHWVAQYVYKRLKFLGSKYLSQLGVLVFLAVWHGLHSGYYMCFFLEFICLVMEKDLKVILERNVTALEFLQKPGIKQLQWVALKIYTLVFMGYCMAPFVLLSFSKWWQVHKSVYFIGHFLWMPWMVYRPILKKLLPPKPHTS